MVDITMILKRIGYIDYISKGSTGTHVTSCWIGGKWKCTCMGFRVRKKCRHLNRLLENMCPVDLDKILNNEDVSKNYKSNLTVLNKLLQDDLYNSDEIVALYGKPDSGKSLLAIQEIAYLSAKGYNILYIDTEGSIIPMMKKWMPIFEKRFGKRKGKIYVEKLKKLESKYDKKGNTEKIGLMEFLGYHVNIEYKSKHKTKKKKGKLEFNVVENISNPEIDKFIEKKKIDFLILDSMSAPLKEFTKSQQNYPARDDASTFILRSLLDKQEKYKVGILMISHACHDEETLTITKEHGIVNYKQVNVGDHVLGLDVDNNTIWTKVNEVAVYPHDGRMISLKGKSTDQLVTPDHRVMVNATHDKYGWKPSKKSLINDGRYIYADSINKSGVNVVRASDNIVPYLDIKQIAMKYPDLFLTGFYVAEGDTQTCNNSKSVRFSINKNELPFVHNIMSKLGFETRKDYINNNSAYVTLQTAYGNIFQHMISDIPNGSENKLIPEYILKNSNKEEQLAFLMGYLYGDGHKRTDNMWYFTTVSEKLLLGLIELSTKLGFAITYRMDVRSNRNKLPRQINQYKESFTGTIRFTNKSWAYPKSEMYHGKVWCLKTDTGNFAIVRNGKVTFSGNTFNPADQYETKAVVTGGQSIKYFGKRLIYVDKRQKQEYKDYRRFWLVRGENAPAWSKAVITLINDEGYNDIEDDNLYNEVFTETELKKLKSD